MIAAPASVDGERGAGMNNNMEFPVSLDPFTAEADKEQVRSGYLTIWSKIKPPLAVAARD